MPGKRNLPKYGLQPQEITPSLLAELDDLKRFCCDDFYPNRVINTCGEPTAENYVYQVKLVLGWFLRYHNPDLTPADLTLTLLVPFVEEEELDELSFRAAAMLAVAPELYKSVGR